MSKVERDNVIPIPVKETKKPSPMLMTLGDLLDSGELTEEELNAPLFDFGKEMDRQTEEIYGKKESTKVSLYLVKSENDA